MARIVVEVPDKMKERLRSYKDEYGYQTLAEAIRAILREVLSKEVNQ